MNDEAAIDRLVADLRRELDRVEPRDLPTELVDGALLVDIRPLEQRRRDGPLPGSVVIDRNVLEWRLDPTCPYRIPEATTRRLRVILVCNEGYGSSIAAASLRRIGLIRATDLVDGFQGWLHANRGSSPYP